MSDPAYLGPALIFACVLLVITVHPVIRLLNVWWVDRELTGVQLSVLLTLHFLVVTVASMFQWLPLILVYYGLLNLYWLLQPCLDRTLRKNNLQLQLNADVTKYERLVNEEPDNPVYQTALGDAYVACERYTEAIPRYQRAIVLLPEHYRRTEQEKLRQAERAHAHASRAKGKSLWQRWCARR